MKRSVVSCACWMSFRSCDAQITHSLAHQKRASKDRGLISLSCAYEWTICAGLPSRLFVLRNQIHLRQIRGAPSVPSLCPGILPLALQSLHSSVGLSKARPCRRLQWAAVMGLKLCALISLSVSTGFQRSHNPTLILPVISLPFPLSETCLLFMTVPGQYSRWTS